MVEIFNMQDLIKKLENKDLPYEVLKDIVFNTFIIDTQLTNKSTIKLLEQNESIIIPDVQPEVETIIDNYLKQVYVISDYGDGFILYKENGGPNV